MHRRRLWGPLALATGSIVLATAAAAPASADEAGTADAGWEVAGDAVLPPPPTGPSSVVHPEAFTDGPGFRTLDPGDGWRFRMADRFTVRLVANAQGNIEDYRGHVVRAVSQITKYTGATFVVAPGTVPDTSPDRVPLPGEILISIDTTSTCSGRWAGCGGPRATVDDSSTGIRTITAGRVWLNQLPPEATEPYKEQLVAHELGHVVGLDHTNWYQSQRQVMAAWGESDNNDPTYGDYKVGDRNGLRFLHPDGRVWELLGGTVVGDPDVASWAPGRLDVFVRGTDNRLYHKWYDGTWHGFEGLGGTLASDPSAVSWGNGRIDVFARGANGHLIHKWFAGGVWSGWEDLGGQLVGAPDAASWAAGRLDVFVRGTDNALHHTWYDGKWHGFESLGGNLTGAPTAVSWGPGRIDVFARHGDIGLYQKTFANGAWGGWFGRGGGPTSDPDVASWAPGRLDLFVRGNDNALYHRTFVNGSWSAWIRRGGTLGSGPGVVSWGADRIDVFARIGKGQLGHKWWDGLTW